MISKDFSYYMPTKVIFGSGALDNIDRYINGKKTVLVTSQGFEYRGGVKKIQSLSNDIVAVFTDVKSHPEFKDLEKTYEKIYDHDFEQIVAIGGGSVIDAAKFFSVYNNTKKASFVSQLIRGKVAKECYQYTPIIAIPTTAGTGSEVTPWATIWDMEEKKKYSLHLPELFPQLAVYDPVLTLSVPKKITVQTGLDTLSHALESIWNKNANEITLSYAIKASKLIVKYLPLLANDLHNLEYRTFILKACMYAGLAFSNTQTALAHAMSYYITANKGVDHGIACSFTLPLIIDEVIGKYDFVDQALEDIFTELSSKQLRMLLSDLGISTRFSDYGIDAREFENVKKSLVNNQRAGNSLAVLS